MKKNILFFTSLKANDSHLDEYKKWALLSWQYYAKKNNMELFILEDPLIDTEVMRPTWQRWYVHEILKHNNIEYEQVAMIDIDTIVHWDCPDIQSIRESLFWS